MISLIVFFLMLVLYRHHRKWSLFLFFVSVTGGCGVIPFGEGALKIQDMGLAFILLICCYHLLIRDKAFFATDKLAKRVWWLLGFVVAVALFSIIYYEVPSVLVLRLIRFHLYILAYFVIRKQSCHDLQGAFNLLGTLTLVTAILFCFQIPLNKSLLLNPNERLEVSDLYGGFSRFTNIPPYADLFLFLSLFTGSTYVLWRFKQKLWVPGIYVLMRLLTMGRTAILTTMGPLLLGICWMRRKYIKWIVVGAVLLTPVLAMVQNSFESRGTGGDIEGILRGDYKHYVVGHKGAGEETTMLYRVAWVYERIIYLSERPLIEQLMGLPYIPDEEASLIRKYCIFSINNYDRTDDDQILNSYDIALGNCVTRFGLLGTVILLSFWGYIWFFFYRNRRHPVAFAALIYSISFALGSIAGTGFADLRNTVVFFALYLLVVKLPNARYESVKTNLLF